MNELGLENIKQKIINNSAISLTIAIPTLNSAETIHIPMRSIINQKKNKFKLQIVLLDSGSVDNTKRNFMQYGNGLNLLFKDIGKCSIGKARNYAIELFESDFFIFLDSDDALTDDRLFCDYKVLNQYQNLSFIYGDSIQINQKSFKKSYYCKSSKVADKFQYLNIPYNLSSLTISRKFLQESNILFKKGKEGRLGEDWRFINEINNKSDKYLYISLPKVIINSREDSHTQDYLKCDLNFSKVDLLIKAFLKARFKKKFLICLFISFQIQASVILAILNILKYTSPRKIKNILRNILKILTLYKEISFFYIILNSIFVPISIYFILFTHRSSKYSPLRKKLTYVQFKQYVSFLSN